MPARAEEIPVMKYYAYTFKISTEGTDLTAEVASDVLSALLADIGFESFTHARDLTMQKVCDPGNPEAASFRYTTDDNTYTAYIQQALLDEAALQAVVDDFPLPGVALSYAKSEPEDRDWNAEWERHYFQPIRVEAGGRSCSIASTFHTDVPDADYAIRIDPRMSFGTGHHQTTSQMLSRLLEMNLTGKEVLDMGCGTSILAILARLRGARHCWAVDVDEWCVANSRDNIRLNRLTGIDVVLGDASALAALPDAPRFDVIIANINRNILLQDMAAYVGVLAPAGYLLMSGFYTEDVPLLEERAASLGLSLLDVRQQDNWACLAFHNAPSATT